MEIFSENVRKIFYRLNDNEQYGLSFGLFPGRHKKYYLDNEELSALIGMSQENTGIDF